MAKSVQLPAAAADHMSDRAVEAIRNAPGAPNISVAEQEEQGTIDPGQWFDLDADSVSLDENLSGEFYIVEGSDPAFVLTGGQSSLLNAWLLNETSFSSVTLASIDGSQQMGTSTTVDPNDTFIILSSEGDYYKVGNVAYDTVQQTYSFDYALL
jgi:hypothetical protein